MLAEDLTSTLLDTLERPDLHTIAGPLDIRLESRLDTAFQVRGVQIRLGNLSLVRPDLAPTILRHAIELGRLRQDTPDIAPELAAFAAARLAALFHELTSSPPDVADTLPWIFALRGDAPPSSQAITEIWPHLAQLLSDAPTRIDATALAKQLAAVWPHLGPTESLMAEGGDARLKVDPQTGLNRYGCSHRPRPWAITFASSTASSLSERGFDGAETARRAMVIALLRGVPPYTARQNATRDARAGIARYYGLNSLDQVLLAASGTDCELAVLAIAASHATHRPITNILVAPDETGSGVPLAAAGRHFATDAANGDIVAKGEIIEGFPQDTALIGVAIRNNDGTPRPMADIDRECAEIAQREIASGRHVILHQLDMSKTGLIGPSSVLIDDLKSQYPQHLDIVVDACQARLEPARVRGMVERGIMVMITGSKFFTGPPFCGAVLLPQTIAAVVSTANLPKGLAEYGHRSEWPPLIRDHSLGNGANIGLALRWHAALAEMTALRSKSPAQIRSTLQSFLAAGIEAINTHPDLVLLAPPPLDRTPIDDRPCWDDVPTILSFLVLDPRNHGSPLALDDARCLHRWLNADLSPWLPDNPLAAQLCHLGQPVPVSAPELVAHHGFGVMAGALRLCAGARLVSGEPSHAGLGDMTRLQRELADARYALTKISLILREWDRLRAADPMPQYAPISKAL